MPGSISLKAVSYTTPDGVELFSNLDLSFGPIRTGLIGRNGTGKTTLLRLITGALAPGAGTVAVSGTIAMLRQLVQPGEATVADALSIADDLARLARLDRGEGSLDDAAAADWALPGRIEAALAEVGPPVARGNAGGPA